ncbi:MAG: O-antigen polymerase [Liquorilactobacillus hordei]|uniref:O-antigen polymerase n=1 Tax=Liquorilactobacillus hordei TaxID=468911 RepID=UPI0039EA4B4A
MVNRSLTIEKNYEFKIRYKLVYFVGVIVIIYFLRDALSSFISVLHGVSLNTIRENVQMEGSSGQNSIDNFIYNFIVMPSASSILILSVADFFLGTKDKKLFFMNICILLLISFSDAGRTPIMNFGLYMLAGFLLFRKKHRLFNKKQVYLFGTLICLLLVYMTFSRTSSTVFRQLYFYFSMAPVLFQKWATNVDASNYHFHGLISFNGIFFGLSYLAKNFLGLPYSNNVIDSYNLIASTNSIWMSIASGNILANAYVSVFWYMYADGRVFGIIFGMLMYGALTSYQYMGMKACPNLKNLSIYFLFYSGIFYSFIRFPFARIDYTICFIMLIFIFFKKDKKIGEKND